MINGKEKDLNTILNNTAKKKIAKDIFDSGIIHSLGYILKANSRSDAVQSGLNNAGIKDSADMFINLSDILLSNDDSYKKLRKDILDTLKNLGNNEDVKLKQVIENYKGLNQTAQASTLGLAIVLTKLLSMENSPTRTSNLNNLKNSLTVKDQYNNTIFSPRAFEGVLRYFPTTKDITKKFDSNVYENPYDEGNTYRVYNGIYNSTYSSIYDETLANDPIVRDTMNALDRGLIGGIKTNKFLVTYNSINLSDNLKAKVIKYARGNSKTAAEEALKNGREYFHHLIISFGLAMKQYKDLKKQVLPTLKKFKL